MAQHKKMKKNYTHDDIRRWNWPSLPAPHAVAAEHSLLLREVIESAGPACNTILRYLKATRACVQEQALGKPYQPPLN